ncbi:hypothetical protein BGT96224_A20247 [Blumeria graminis f. sp. tritici 96224]|nr:hypothetical protein BGT96224_A20247 [Blumeria graminis f. sp. tritici 96224]
MSADRGASTNNNVSDLYTVQTELNPLPVSFSGQPNNLHSGPGSGTKRVRDDEEETRPPSRNSINDIDSMKRRKAVSISGPPGYEAPALGRVRSQISQRRR